MPLQPNENSYYRHWSVTLNLRRRYNPANTALSSESKENGRQITITGHQLDITEALRECINGKFAKLDRHFDKITSIRVTLGVEKVKQKIDATLLIAGGEIIANAEHDDMYAAIDLLVDKLDRQLIKHKEKQR